MFGPESDTGSDGHDGLGTRALCATIHAARCHLASNNPQFHTVYVECTHLAEWVKRLPEQRIDGMAVRVNYTTKAEDFLSADVGRPEGHLSIRSYLNPSYSSTEFHITSRSVWAFSAAKSIDLEAALLLSRHCQNFLTLVLGMPSDVTSIFLVPLPEAADGPQQLGGNLIASLMRSSGADRPHLLDPLLRFDQVGSDGATILQKWFEIQDEISEVINLMFASRYVSSYTTTEFLNVTQALESLHRRTFPGHYYPTDEYQGIQQSLLDAMPTGLKSEFQNKLRGLYEYANEYSLRRRLKELCASLASNTRGWIATDVDAFVQKVVKTRNYLIHLDPKSIEGSFIKGPDDLGDLWQANRILTGLATVLILRQIGIPEEKITGRVFRWP
jgi:ApeA N-terminal domain 1